jgi:hypothetical protein
MKQRIPLDKRVRKNISMLESVIAKAKELTADRNMGNHKFSQLLSDLVLAEHRRQGSDEAKSILMLLERIARLEKEIEEWKGKHRQALAFAGEHDYQADRAWKRVKELENEARDRRLEDLRQEYKKSHQAKDPTKTGTPAT